MSPEPLRERLLKLIEIWERSIRPDDNDECGPMRDFIYQTVAAELRAVLAQTPEDIECWFKNTDQLIADGERVIAVARNLKHSAQTPEEQP